MLIRSLTLATLLAVVGPVLAADSDSPLAQERGKTRPLIVIAPSSADPTLVNLKKSLDEPDNKKAVQERNIVLFTVVGLTGQRDGKDMGTQDTMALIRELKLGASKDTNVVLVGKDGEKKPLLDGPIVAKTIFDTVDQLPAAEKEIAPPAPPVAETPPAKGAKATKPGKPAKPPQPLDD